MKIVRSDGCTSHGYISINNKGFEYLTEEEKQEVWSEILNSLEYSEENLLDLLNWYIDVFGKYKYLYTCDQCGDSVGEYIVEINMDQYLE